MSSWDFRVWLVAEEIKALEREGKKGCLQHERLLIKYRELTGREWDGDKTIAIGQE